MEIVGCHGNVFVNTVFAAAETGANEPLPSNVQCLLLKKNYPSAVNAV
jgi:hypothetical protein